MSKSSKALVIKPAYSVFDTCPCLSKGHILLRYIFRKININFGHDIFIYIAEEVEVV